MIFMTLVNFDWSKFALCGLAGCLALVKSFEEAVCSVLLWLEVMQKVRSQLAKWHQAGGS